MLIGQADDSISKISFANTAMSLTLDQYSNTRYMGITLNGTNGRFTLIVQEDGILIWDAVNGVTLHRLAWDS